MAEVMDVKGSYLAQLERLESAGRPNWLTPMRRRAMARFAELGFPTTRDEEWRFTNVGPIARTVFERAGGTAVAQGPGDLDPFLFDGAAAVAVFVNGVFAPTLSALETLPAGVQVASLADAVVRQAPPVRAHLGQHACYEDDAFTALNTALMEDGAFVHVPRETVVEAPIHLLFVSTCPDRAVMTQPRSLIVAETSSQAAIVESFVGCGPGVYFTNAVTELIVADNAMVDHCKVGRDGPDAFHIATLHLRLGRSSRVTSHGVTLGGSLVRNNIHAVLAGEGAECTLNGFYMVGGTQHVDNHLLVDHAMPHGNSREFFKGILDGKGRGVFSGRIIVRPDAQKTDAKQSNASLLLSPGAQVESKPQLEILANDVKCTHGATIGQVSKEAIFYLRSRGLSEEAARNLLVYAFALGSVETLRPETLRARLEKLLLARLPHGHVMVEAV